MLALEREAAFISIAQVSARLVARPSEIIPTTGCANITLCARSAPAVGANMATFVKSDDATRFVRVEFSRFKAFKKFSFSLRHFNILVGPNNAGKSTILAAFRILAAGMRRAYNRKPEVINGPIGTGMTHGYSRQGSA